MDSVKWTLFLGGLCLTVPQTEASSWTVKVPSSVKGLPGSCVVIPCSFNYPDPGWTVTELTGMWLSDTNELIYHPEQSKTMQQYRSRTQLVGDLRHKTCSLKIDPLQESDRGPFFFRIEIKGHDKYSYKEKKVSIAMINELPPISFSVKEGVTEGQNVSASCSVSHSCPSSPPVFTWSLSGQAHVQPQQLEDGQWRATSTLTFHPTIVDHNKRLECTVTYHGGRHHKTSKVLKVNYAPHVKVEYKSDVKEGEAVHLTCSSDANPPASSYEWQNEIGAMLHQGNVFMLPNVSRQHTGALYCTATNTIGQGKSSPVQLSVSYAPHVKVEYKSDVKEGEAVHLTCSSDANPPASSYEWRNEIGAMLHQGNVFMLPNVSRQHTGALYCTATNTIGQGKSSPVQLNVSYAPHVKVEYKSDVKEGEAVHLTCSSDANPPASSYEWRNESGAMLHQGNVFMLPNISRQHTGALYCTTTNTIGQGKSSAVRLNVLYAPEVKTMSSCSSETDTVKCVCTVDSKPPSRVYFVLSDKVLPSTKVETHSSLTIGTLQADLGSYASVLCLANNTQGSASLSLSVNSKMQSYIIIAVGAGIGVTILMLLIAVGVVIKCRGRSGQAPTSHMSTKMAHKNVELPEYAATKRGETRYEDVHYPDMHPDDPVYGNIENDWDDAIYANV
ncbi:sialoadhesin-like isoform X1 [Acanthopagrus latus]|uniref:sialoadhesin-like isoform X1 n=1 Tax=Acanthopagrus latus TaxID=8177 RepID=UPI00187C3B38|nr:sialoadhesin-like isoform X1 [Acanthopagrus latus]XP_036929698.1 sialoadhesin-like isoform X1 [Acanthopagrus latus]XP_036929699.1 sialoadhesin-like isoform X1 [Acanthopagrus latus]